MNKIHIPLFIMIILVCTSCIKKVKENTEPGIAIMAYYMPRNNYDPEEIPVEKLTHIIFSFTEVIDNRMEFPNRDLEKKLTKMVDRKTDNPDLKVMIACGGWGGSGGFSDMASTGENRRIFVESAIEFINDFELDGIDIDWEYPGLPGIGNPYRPEDRQNFTLLMKELREAMDNTGRDLTLTFAAAAWNQYFENIETNEVMKYADYINLMTYDFTGGDAPFTMHHTNLGALSIEDFNNTPLADFIGDSLAIINPGWQPRSIISIVDYCKQIGIEQNQIIIGAAFYGKSWKVYDGANNGLYQPAKGSQSGWPSYAAITNELIPEQGYEKHWDKNAQAPWLFNPSDSTFITYDDKKSVSLKTEYVLKEDLGGIMFWEQSQDTKDGNGLLEAIYSTVNGS